jgi:prepilin-type N-terminal cleavage/methylation domain-containing protein
MHRAPVAPVHVRRRGFTLVELMISLVLLVLMGGALARLLTGQQRFYRSAQEALDLRAELRHAGMLLPTDLRTISPLNGDVYAWNDTMIEFRQLAGSGVLCRINAAAGGTQQVVLPPLRLSRQSTVTSWTTTPEPGDSVLVYDEGPFVGNFDDVWRAYAITGVATTNAGLACSAAYLSTAADIASSSFRLTLALPAGQAALPAGVMEGAPLRIFRRARYSLFQQASDGLWYLGQSDCLAGRAPVCSAPSAVSGPYRPYSSTTPATSGLRFTYWNSAGAQLVPGVSAVETIARIDVITRTATTRVSALGVGRTQYFDSLNTSVGLRNR